LANHLSALALNFAYWVDEPVAPIFKGIGCSPLPLRG
jgi:hypothetical protein